MIGSAMFPFPIRAVVLCLILTPAFLCGSESSPLIDADFGRAGSYAAITNHERVTGELPQGWRDDSTWAKAWIGYTRVVEDGKGFLRVNVSRVELDHGRCLLKFDLPKITAESYFRLTFTARSSAQAMVEAGIRMVEKDYRFLWSVRPKLRSEWREFSYDFKLDADDRAVGFWISAPEGVTQYDLSSLRLVRRTREEFIDALKHESAEAPPNLLAVTRFPLGMQSGMSLRRDFSDGDDVKIEADRGVTTGPSGAPALRIIAGEPMSMYFSPFAVPRSFETHTASLYVRGKFSGRIIVQCLDPKSEELRWLAWKPVESGAGSEWQRIEVPFEPVLLNRMYALRLDLLKGPGDVWIDALQVNAGKTAIAYAQQKSSEVALSCDSPIRAQFDDEAPQIHWCVTGAVAGAKLELKVINLYEQQTVAIPLGDYPLQEGQFHYGKFADLSYGPWRIEARVTRNGEALSAFNELVFYRLHRPHYWEKDAPDSPFGAHMLSTTRHILMAKAAGINWVRLHDLGYNDWFNLEKEPGKWTFFDKEIARYRQHGLRILGMLSTAPAWASQIDQVRKTYLDRFWQPRNYDAFANYVKTLTTRYAGSIDYYDVWNEPWNFEFFPGGFDETRKLEYSDTTHYGYLPGKSSDFAHLMSVAYKAAKSSLPSLNLTGFNSTAAPAGEKWSRDVLNYGGLNDCDIVCYHQYTHNFIGGPNDAAEQGYRTAIGPIVEKEGKLPKPVWMTEGASLELPDAIRSGYYHYTLPYDNDEDVVETSDRLCRFVVGHLAQGIHKIFLYSMHAHNYFGGQGEYRTLVTDEGYLHPSAAAHSALAWYLEDTKFVRSEQLARGVTAYLFDGPGRSVAVLSGAPNHEAYTPAHSENIETVDLFGNPWPKGKPLGSTLVYLSARNIESLLDALKNATQK